MSITGITDVVSAAAADDKDDVTFVSGTRGIVAIDALAVAELIVARGITVKKKFFLTTLAFFAGGEGMLGTRDHILYILKMTVIYLIFICAVKRTYFPVQK